MFSDDAARLAGLAGALLGWRPDEFWRATPAELMAVLVVLNDGSGAAPVSREELAQLKEIFPDG